MGKKVVGIVASPRKGMNTDTLVTKVLEGALSAGADIENIFLNDLDIKPCQACDKQPFPEHCIFHDGMDTVYTAIETADAIITGTPAYYGTISAQLKLVIDRSNCLVEMTTLPNSKPVFKSRIERRKKGIFIWLADTSRDPGPALAMVRPWCKDVNIELAETLIVTDSDRGTVARNRSDLLSKAFELGVSLIKA